MWLTIYKRGKVSQNTYTGYEACVKTHIKPALGNKRLQALKKSELQGLLNTLLQNVNHAAAQKVRVTIGQIIATAVEDGYITCDKSRGLSLPPARKSEKRVLSDDGMINSAELDTKQRAFVDLLLYTDLRRDEATHHIDVESADINKQSLPNMR